MQVHPDKEFDAGLRQKLEHLECEAPPGLWDSIEEELSGAKKGKSRTLIWWMAAASLTLLAVAGIWVLRPGRLAKTEIGMNVPKDSVKTGIGSAPVIILNRSRQRPDSPAGKDAPGAPAGGWKQVPEANASPGTEKQAGGEPTAPASSEKPPVSEEIMAKSGQRESGGEEAAVSAGTPPASDRQPSAGSGEELARQQPAEQVERPEPLSLDIEETLALNPVPKLDEIKQSAGPTGDQETSAAEALGEPAGRRRPEAGSRDAEARRPAGQGPIASLMPQKIRELSGVGEALNLVTSTLDRSENAFLNVRKDEESGKWKGFSLDLGIVTISYSRSEKERQKSEQ